jgi:hypothetical protein
MILGIKVSANAEPTIFGIDADGHPRWLGFAEVTFDWRWSSELGRWADLEELTDPPSAKSSARPSMVDTPSGRNRRRG